MIGYFAHDDGWSPLRYYLYFLTFKLPIVAYTSWSFLVTQSVGEPSTVTTTAVVAGTDGAVTQRRVYLQTDTGEFLVPSGTTADYTQWSIGAASIDIDCLDKDYALRIVVEWLDVNNAVLYSSEQFVGLTLYNESFDYLTTQLMAGNPLLVNDNNFWSNKAKLRTLIDSGNNAITFASDLYNAQQCYDAATELRTDSQYLFNGNS